MKDIDLEVNVEDIEGGDDQYIKPGRYLLRVDKLKREWTKDGSKEFISCELKTVDTQSEECVGSLDRTVYEIFNLNEKALWKLKSFLDACYPGLTGNKIPSDIIGKHLSAVVYVDKYQGNENFRIKRPIEASDWEGLEYHMDENGNLVPESAEESSGSNGKTEAKSKGKSKPAALPSNDEEVEL